MTIGATLKCINIYEEWRPVGDDNWREYRIQEYTDGSATSQVIGNIITKKEYFKLTLEGRI